MNQPNRIRILKQLFSDYGMLLVLLVLGVFLSVATIEKQQPVGADAGRRVAAAILDMPQESLNVAVVIRSQQGDRQMAGAVAEALKDSPANLVEVIEGNPQTAREALARIAARNVPLDVLVVNDATARWGLDNLGDRYPQFADIQLFQPEPYYWPTFLKSDNLLNITNQIAVIAIIASGMTLVIITGGIDLSVGSLIALSSVVTAMLIRDYFGGIEASVWAMVLCAAIGVFVCSCSGLFSGTMVTLFRIPPFIVTLAMMLVASGAAERLSENQSIDKIPESFIWLGRGTDLFRLPNAVVLTILIYVVLHIFMTCTAWGRYIYAVGGNREAARLSGVPVRRVLLMVYVLCGALAGLGGIVMTSTLKSGAPTYGNMYELTAIAAVVVGGTSLMGGEGKVLNTMIGALIIAVIQNGMNLKNLESDVQQIVLGLVILIAVALDNLKRFGFSIMKPGE